MKKLLFLLLLMFAFAQTEIGDLKINNSEIKW